VKGQKVVRVRVGDLILDPDNARRHPMDNLAAIRESIRAFGQQKPIVAYPFAKKGPMTVIAGNGALQVMRELAFEEVDVAIFAGTPEQARAFALADNRTSELSTWDLEVLGAQVDMMAQAESLQELAASLRFDQLLTPEDSSGSDYDTAPPVPKHPITKLGDVWALGHHRLACADSGAGGILNALAAMKDGTLAHLCVTDPPWNVAYGTNRHPRYKARQIKNDNLGAGFDTFLSAAFRLAHGGMHPGAALYCAMSPQEWGTGMQVLEAEGFHWSSTIIWAKDVLVFSRKDYHTQYEPLWYGWKDDAPRIRKLVDRKQSDLWFFDRPQASAEHPTMKPVGLMEKCIRNSSRIGDVVLEPFAGSGTTLMACERLGRRCAAVELDPGYCDVIVQRWEDKTGRKAVRA